MKLSEKLEKMAKAIGKIALVVKDWEAQSDYDLDDFIRLKYPELAQLSEEDLSYYFDDSIEEEEETLKSKKFGSLKERFACLKAKKQKLKKLKKLKKKNN